MRRIAIPILAAGALTLGACTNGPLGGSGVSPTLAGTGIGAAAGGILGSLSGDFGWGALIGAGAGALGGYLYDRNTQQS